MAKFFRKRRVVVEAMQWTGEITGVNGLGVLTNFCPDMDPFVHAMVTLVNGKAFFDQVNGEPMLRIKTLEGEHWAALGDWIVKGVEGEFYPVKPSIFEATYEPVPISRAQSELNA